MKINLKKMTKILSMSLKKLEHLIRGYSTEFVKMTEK
jgi:ribosomal protein S17E